MLTECHATYHWTLELFASKLGVRMMIRLNIRFDHLAYMHDLQYIMRLL